LHRSLSPPAASIGRRRDERRPVARRRPLRCRPVPGASDLAEIAPSPSIAVGVATRPETATSVTVRLGPGGRVEVCAPHGPNDLLGGVWRRNLRRVSVQPSRGRPARHDPARRRPGSYFDRVLPQWPELIVLSRR
jgi:hypothetical protein